MIITRSPLRISLGGGGTDLPSYYREHGGFLIAGAIDKYVYITLHETFVPEIIVRYSKMEAVASVDEIQHPIIREAMKLIAIEEPHLEITSMADIPAGTGLGSSGSFTTALLKALHAYSRNHVSPRELAEQACHIEIDLLGEPIGKQDQYIAAYGGITFHLPAGRPAWRSSRCGFRRDAAQPGRQPAAVLHRLYPQRVGDPQGSGRAQQAEGPGDDREPALRQGLGYESKAALEAGRSAGFRRADARPLGAQEARRTRA